MKDEHENSRYTEFPWIRESVQKNPYRRPAFAIVRVPVLESQKRRIVQRAERTKKLCETTPESHVIDGKPVTKSEVNQALSRLLTSNTRIGEELIVHHPAMVPWDRLKKFQHYLEWVIGQKIEVESPSSRGFPPPFG